MALFQLFLTFLIFLPPYFHMHVFFIIFNYRKNLFFLRILSGEYHWKGSWNSMQHWSANGFNKFCWNEKIHSKYFYAHLWMKTRSFYSFSYIFIYFALYMHIRKIKREYKTIGEKFYHVFNIFYKLMKFDAKIHKKEKYFYIDEEVL